MIAQLALVAVLLAATWLVLFGVVCIVRPWVAPDFLARMGSTWPIHLGEQALRALAGVALVVRADMSKAPDLFAVAGWFVVVSSVLILLLPRDWHQRYSRWWADRIPTACWRLIGLAGMTVGGLTGIAAL